MRELIIEHCAVNSTSAPRVRVSYRASERAQAQGREGDFIFDYTPDDRELIRWYLEDYLQCPWGVFGERARRAEAAMQRIGAELFEAVFQGETRELYDNIRNDLGQSRIVIYAAHPDGVALPWELLRDPKRENCDLARLAHSFTRSQPNLDYDPPTFEGEGTFNILLVICRPDGESDVPFQSVARRLLAAVRSHRDRIRVDVLRPPTFEQLAKVLEDRPNFYHALHFDGHGAFHSQNEQGVLFFEGESAPQRPITGSELGQLLTGHHLPLVVLNACQSGTTQIQAAYPSVGNQLLQAGVGAVVAMAYSVYVTSAADFMARFYERLAQGQEVSRAVHAGRADLFASKMRFSPLGELPLPDWIVPILFEATEIRLPAPPQGVRLRLQQGADKGEPLLAFPDSPPLGLIGRDEPILRLERAFRHENVVLLRGMAGIGKTSTATGFARWLGDTGGLEERAFYFSFEHHLTLAGVCARIGFAFGALIKSQTGQEWAVQDAVTRRGLILQILRQLTCFLVWDNFEPVGGFPMGATSDWTAHEQNELREFLRGLRGGKTKVLISSRREEKWLGNIYREVELNGLDLRESQEFAVAVLRRAGLDHHALRNLSNYNDLLHYLRGNPLAIQAILPEIKRQDPAILLTALQTGEAKFEDDSSQGRERSLTASLNYRFDQIEVKTREKLGLLGLFQGFVNTHVLTAISEQEDAPQVIKNLTWEQWDKTLGHVAEVGLLEGLGMGRYSLHPALPWFFKSLFDVYEDDDKDWIEQAFCKAGCGVGRGLLEMSQSMPSAAFCQAAFEEANLKYALTLCEKHESWDCAIGILDGLHVLLPHQGRWSEWESLILSIRSKIVSSEGTPIPSATRLWPASLGYLSRIAEFRRQFAEKLQIDRELETYFRASGDESNVANALQHQGICAEAMGNFTEAESLYRQSASIHFRLKDKHSEAVSLGQIASLAFNRRDLVQAERLIQQILPVFERSGDEKYEAQSLHNLGNVYAEQQKWSEAIKCFDASQQLCEKLGDVQGSANNLNHMGITALRMKKFDLAERYLRSSLVIAEETTNQHLRCRILLTLGSLGEQRNNGREALEFYEEAHKSGQLAHNPALVSNAEKAVLRVKSRFNLN